MVAAIQIQIVLLLFWISTVFRGNISSVFPIKTVDNDESEKLGRCFWKKMLLLSFINVIFHKIHLHCTDVEAENLRIELQQMIFFIIKQSVNYFLD